MRVACLQMCSGGEIGVNLETAAALLEQAAEKGVRLAVLPENFAFMHPDNARKHQVARHDVPERVLRFLADSAAQFQMFLVGGSVLLEGSHGKLRNTSPVYGPDGTCVGVYDKVHLFDVDLPGESYHESELVAHGLGPLSVAVDDWRMGLSICYDLRFPELYRCYAAESCEILTIPSAFTVLTGEAHWEILLRARAIENQAYVLAPAQVGTHPGGRCTWGRSMIVDPWGEILAEGASIRGSSEPALLTAELDPARLAAIRSELPALQHRRLGPREEAQNGVDRIG